MSLMINSYYRLFLLIFNESNMSNDSGSDTSIEEVRPSKRQCSNSLDKACIVCKKSIKKMQKKDFYFITENKKLEFEILLKMSVNIDDIICKKDYARLNKQVLQEKVT